MQTGKLSWRIAVGVVFLLFAATGCAPAYHDYPCGCVPYGYCPPPPLPYATYCGCPTPIASQYAGAAAPDAAVEMSDSGPASPERPAN